MTETIPIYELADLVGAAGDHIKVTYIGWFMSAGHLPTNAKAGDFAQVGKGNEVWACNSTASIKNEWVKMERDELEECERDGWKPEFEILKPNKELFPAPFIEAMDELSKRRY